MRSALAAALACGLLIGTEATAFAWLFDIVLADILDITGTGGLILAWSGVVIGVAACAWTAVKVYHAELRIAAEG